ncbi:hypothetical protein PsorP6_013476 [Peronosclerospora sorghi]|uniref:Uncharacterized protein n=1 Tax=Peronosclerospora sorghi TaxID=230839 RepID=A0ACC0VHV4_9STRA|nr:hypothetical protein PsorP6_013476 [Peronosclerospora sorghi]
MKMDLRREEQESKVDFRCRELELKNKEMYLRLEEAVERRLLLQLQLRKLEAASSHRGALLNPRYFHQE